MTTPELPVENLSKHNPLSDIDIRDILMVFDDTSALFAMIGYLEIVAGVAFQVNELLTTGLMTEAASVTAHAGVMNKIPASTRD